MYIGVLPTFFVYVRVLDPLELELKTTVSYVGAGNRTWDL